MVSITNYLLYFIGKLSKPTFIQLNCLEYCICLFNDFQTLGLTQIAVTAFVIHMIIQDESYVVFLMGHSVFKVTDDMNQALQFFEEHKGNHHLIQDLMVLKIAASVAMCSAAIQIFSSCAGLYVVSVSAFQSIINLIEQIYD